MERLDPKTTAILIVDVQEKLAAAMPEESMSSLVKNTTILLEAAKVLGVRVIVSEQYPKGLGPTIPALQEMLTSMGVKPLPKVTFDGCSDLGVARALADSGARNIVIVGMETHVCVFQTARELVKRDYSAHVVSDAVSSRKKKNRRIGLSLCEQAGAVITGTETVVFDLLERAGTDAFKAVSKLLR